jgi:acylglycerol lipase
MKKNLHSRFLHRPAIKDLSLLTVLLALSVDMVAAAAPAQVSKTHPGSGQAAVRHTTNAASTGAAAPASSASSATTSSGASSAVTSAGPGAKTIGRRVSADSLPQEKIPCLRWADETLKPRAVLFCIHGLGLHKGCYEDFGKAMAKQGLIVYAIDVRGFGEWVTKQKNDKVDFDGTMADIKRALIQIRSKNPGLPVVVLGESMGGGIGLHATAQFPDLIDGLVSSVPAGDRYGATEGKIKVGMHAIFGMGKKMDVGTGVIKQATKKEDLREKWGNDPLARKDLTPAELISFQNFMNNNFAEAAQIKDKPVLFIQGCEDKLVIPAGTLKLYESVASPRKNKVLSETAEHLIFEEGQFSPKDLSYVTGWIDRNVIARQDDSNGQTTASGTSTGNAATDTTTGATAAAGGAATTASAFDPAVATIHIQKAPAVATKSDDLASAKADSASFAAALKGTPIKANDKVAGEGPAISYWIELYRGGKVYRCNNKIAFQSGDAIRFHIIPKTNGYAYLLMKQGSSGKRAILFPSKATGDNNYLKAGTDYPVPNKDWLSFDNTPGIEKVSLLFSHKKVLTGEEFDKPTNLAYISNDRSGAKDLVPTRMQLSWDDPTPVILPDSMSPDKLGSQQVTSSDGGSLVKVSFNDPGGLLAVDVALAHQ